MLSVLLVPFIVSLTRMEATMKGGVVYLLNSDAHIFGFVCSFFIIILGQGLFMWPVIHRHSPTSAFQMLELKSRVSMSSPQ